MFRTLTRGFSSSLRTSPMPGSVLVNKNKDFNWQKLQSPWTHPGFISRMKDLEAKFLAMRNELKGVPKTIEPIDWAYWEQNISTPGVVASIRKEYESLKFAKAKGQDLTAINSQLDNAINRTNENAELSKQELTKLRTTLDNAKKEKVAVHSWKYEDYVARYPGLNVQLRTEYMNGYQLPTDAEDRLGETDINQLRTQFKNNQNSALDLSEDIPKKVGDLDFETELKRVEELEKKMFGDNPLYQTYIADVKAQEEKEKAKNAEHH